MKNEITSKMDYSPPELQILEITIEKGYASSYGDVSAGQWEDGSEEGTLSDW